MKHYSDESWTDFARGAVAADRNDEMAAHLATGCEMCRSAVTWISQIQQIAALDTSIPVPPGVVHAALEIFPQANRTNQWLGTLRQVAAELIFDAGLAWQPLGIRSAVMPASTDPGGRMIFDAENYRIHVKIERPTLGEPGEIVGEIKNRLDPADRLEGVVVQALSSGRSLGQTTTNRFGEFLIDYPFVDDTMLRLGLKDKGVRIDLMLDRKNRQKSGRIESQH